MEKAAGMKKTKGMGSKAPMPGMKKSPPIGAGKGPAMMKAGRKKPYGGKK